MATKQLELIPDDRGWLMEILRSDWDIYEKFGQVYLTTVYPNVVKAWHYHKVQTDHFACVSGMIKLVLYDARRNSKTRGQVNEFFLGERNTMLVKVPPLVYHGFKGLGTQPAYVVNIPTELYNYEKPDEFREPPDSKKIPYTWPLAPGLKHG